MTAHTVILCAFLPEWYVLSRQMTAHLLQQLCFPCFMPGAGPISPLLQHQVRVHFREVDGVSWVSVVSVAELHCVCSLLLVCCSCASAWARCLSCFWSLLSNAHVYLYLVMPYRPAASGCKTLSEAVLSSCLAGSMHDTTDMSCHCTVAMATVRSTPPQRMKPCQRCNLMSE